MAQANSAEINQRTYRAGKIVESYVGGEILQEPEKAILDAIAVEIRGKRVLDLGVGGGRTTSFLKPLAGSYLGIDYSQEMVEKARAAYPQVEFLCMDARNLEGLGRGEFDFVMFSFNGIDYVDDSDRKRILSGIHCSLAPGGILAFSSHNLDHWKTHPGEPHPFKVRKGLRANLSELKRVLIERRNHRRNKAAEVVGGDYEIVNDRAHNFTLLTYYISIGAQIAQLRSLGFRGAIRCFDRSGNDVSSNSESVWIYYLVRKSDG